jgi:hypothetical protein
MFIGANTVKGKTILAKSVKWKQCTLVLEAAALFDVHLGQITDRITFSGIGEGK